MTEPAGYDYFETEADIGVHAWGRSAAEAFAQAALGVLALTVEPSDVAPREHREVRAQGATSEALLVNWINECLYVHEIEGFVARRVEVDVCEPSVVHGVLHGEEIDRTRHNLGTVVKAATLHRVQVEHDGRWDVRVVVDV
ncbi:MAG: archease [Candidatus Rokubacteria bacterium]|nr:archease [Candidatus Rokubacteria bacterium]